MTKAIRIHVNGGPEVMQWEDVPTPEPGNGEALLECVVGILIVIQMKQRASDLIV